MSEPATDRLVIRIKLVSQEPPQPPARRLGNGALRIVVGVVAVLLAWLGISTFRSEPAPPPAAVEKAPIAAARPMPEPAKAVEPEVQPDAPTSAINQVIPDVPQSALDTIRGTIRVIVRVSIDKQGTVVAATADDRGPSRYFERLALEASKKWTFTPAKSQDQRTMPVRFNFTRYGATATLVQE